MKKKKIITAVSSTPSMPPVDKNFIQGSMASYVIEDTNIPRIRITPVRHWNNQWAWWAVRSRDWAKKTPEFLIAKSGHYSFDINEKLCVWSISSNTDDWYLFDHQIDTGTDLSFYNDTPFPGGIIYISALPMYPFSRTQQRLAEWLGNPLSSLTLSGSSGGIVGYTTARNMNDGSGRTVPSLPYYGFKVSSGSSAILKNKAVITAYSHPSETPGPFQLEGGVQWLLGGSTEANNLLDYFDLYIYPNINPQGSYSGYFRSFPEDKTQDHNRIWDTSGSYEDVDKLITVMKTDTSSSAVIAIDFHSWMSAGATPFITATASSSPYIVEFLNKIKSVRPVYSSQDSDIPTSLKARQALELGTLMEAGPEIAGALSITVPEYKNIGKDVFRGLELMNREGWFPNGPSVGSRSFNGTSDRIDWTNIANLKESPITISAWINALDASTTSDYILHIHPEGNTNFGIVFYIYSTNLIGLIRNGTVPYTWRTANFSWANAWHNVLVTHDGSYDFTKIHIYMDGIEETSYANEQNGSAELVTSGSWSVGGRIYDDLRNFSGSIAQVGCWNRVLTNSEIQLLGSGYAPSFFQDNLLFYFKGNTDSLNNETSGIAGTPDGSTFLTGHPYGPPIIYPSPIHYTLEVQSIGTKQTGNF